MRIPLIGFDGDGLPLMGVRITGSDDEQTHPLEVVRRLGLASPVLLCFPEAILSAPPSEAMLELLREAMCIVGPFSFDHADDARNWLSAGATHALFMLPRTTGEQRTADAIKAASKELAIPGDRMVLLVDAPAQEVGAMDRFSTEIEALAASSGSGLYECCRPETVGTVAGVVVVLPPDTARTHEAEILNVLGSHALRDRLQVFVGGISAESPLTIGQLHHSYNIHSLGTASLVDTTKLTVPLSAAPNLPMAATALAPLFAVAPLEIGPTVAACIRTDRSDGLMPTVVLEADGVALGLVYSSSASIGAAMQCGRGVYWSRSRQSLWRKGDTSGSWQTLRRIRLDCDGDALAFTVTQHGEPPAFCHKATLSCWGFPSGLHGLQVMLRSRKASAPPGSYTKRLFDDATLLRNKLVEEAQELAEATEPDHVASEAADLMYFAMTRCVAAGVSLADVASHLDRRTYKLNRRPGNSKAERIAAGDAILQVRATVAAGSLHSRASALHACVVRVTMRLPCSSLCSPTHASRLKASSTS